MASLAFNKTLLSNESREAVLQKQDAELRLFECMRRCIQARVKCDHDYAVALEGVVLLAQRLGSSPVDSTQSSASLFKVWHNVMVETKSMVALLSKRSGVLSSETLDTITQLIADRKMARKQFADEKLQTDADMRKVQETVNRLQMEYNKFMEKVNQKRTELDDLQQKGKAGKLDDVKRKYASFCERLSILHNEYVLYLRESRKFQEDVHHDTIPNWLSSCQKHMESATLQCKRVLQEYIRLTDTSSSEHQSICKNMAAAVQTIDPVMEYCGFVTANRKEAEILPLGFDENSFKGYVGTLRPNEVAVDMDSREAFAKSRADYCQKAKDADIVARQTDAELKTACESLNAMNAAPDKHHLELERKQIEVATLSRRSKEQVCTRDRLTFMLTYMDDELKAIDEKVKVALAAANGQPPTKEPSGNVPDTSSTVASIRLPSPAAEGNRSSSMGNISNTLANLFIKIKSAAVDRSSGDGASMGKDAAGSSEPVTVAAKKQGLAGGTAPALTKMPSFSEGEKEEDIVAPLLHSSSKLRILQKKLSYEDTALKEEPGNPLDTETSGCLQPSAAVVSNTELVLEDVGWYHGILPRDEIERLLREEGDYLVRKSKKKENSCFVLSVRALLPGAVLTSKHFIIQSTDSGWKLEGQSFPTIQELIVHQQRSGCPVTARSQLILRRPVIRETWQLNNDDVKLDCKVGSGNFGDVYKGSYKGKIVAIKTCKEDLSEEQKRKFLGEGRILRQYDHPNIVQFIGIAAQKNPVMIVMEYISGGALLTWLRIHNDEPHTNLTKMCIDAASGMEYLGTKNIIHRDLAARNCLVGDNRTVKISDFGMSREESEYIMSGVSPQIPIKWTAPEALNFGKYTVMCDVWSYGILMWEVFSGGKNPYPGMRNQEARERVDDGHRMSQPVGCPPLVYDIMCRCWSHTPEDRPNFTEIIKLLHTVGTAVM